MWLTEDQIEVCLRFEQQPVPAALHDKLGIARNVVPGAQPINGLRHPPEANTCGWYLWAGEELPEDEDFFEPLHVSHLPTRCPAVIRFLALPPGWRFLIAADYEDVWYDEGLLEV